MDKKQSQSGFAHLAIILVLVVALLGALGFVFWQNFMQPKTNDTVNTDNSTVKVVATNELDIPDVGIKIINIPTSLSDLYYYYDSADTSFLKTTGFGTKQLDTASVNTCVPSNHSQSIGMLMKREGTYDGSGLPSAAFVKQFTGFFITYTHPQAPCDLDNVVGIDAISVQALFVYQTSVFEALAVNPDNIVAR